MLGVILLASKFPCSEYYIYREVLIQRSKPHAQNVETCRRAHNAQPAKENDCLLCEPRRLEAESGCIAVIVTTLPF